MSIFLPENFSMTIPVSTQYIASKQQIAIGMPTLCCFWHMTGKNRAMTVKVLLL